jgi:3-hydroxy-9,10-secoandrosta-1,3,5(10)-triene-9,17-dione monooxygenase reductase component
MIDQSIKRCLGQMVEGVQVVAAAHGGTVRAYTSHWVSQISFGEPIVMASVSPLHDTWPLISDSGRFAVSLLAGDQIEEGQWFSYPGRRFEQLIDTYLEPVGSAHDPGEPWWVVRNCIAWLGCEVLSIGETAGPEGPRLDHRLVFARVVDVGEGRTREPALVYSSRQGWRVSSEKARTTEGGSVRDRLLARVDAIRAAAGAPPLEEADD